MPEVEVLPVEQAVETVVPETAAAPVIDKTPEPGTESTPEPKEVREPWFQKRINELTWKAGEAQRKADALAALLEQRGEPTPQAQPDIETLVNQRAAVLSRQQAINEAADKTYDVGKSKYADFDSAVNNMRNVADLSQTPHFLEAVTRLPNGADIYYHLGKNLDEAAHVLALSPVQMGLELAKLSASLGKPKPVSKVPEPVSPVGGNAASDDSLRDDLPIEEWMRRRNKQLGR